MYKKPGSAPPQQQIVALNETVQRAEDRSLSVGPGIYAHLGYMYALDGQQAKSHAALQQEMALFPESKPLIDGMLERALQAMNRSSVEPTHVNQAEEKRGSHVE